jgi:hypothetical protein
MDNLPKENSAHFTDRQTWNRPGSKRVTGWVFVMDEGSRLRWEKRGAAAAHWLCPHNVPAISLLFRVAQNDLPTFVSPRSLL